MTKIVTEPKHRNINAKTIFPRYGRIKGHKFFKEDTFWEDGGRLILRLGIRIHSVTTRILLSHAFMNKKEEYCFNKKAI
ncbi:MAG: hypothetical protein IPN42_06110 [Methylococcaceae bacterium]|nr:hypothetical protein [Methylococcaceae bacterium]